MKIRSKIILSFLSLLMVPMIVVMLFILIVFNNIFQIPYFDKIVSADEAISTLSEKVSANYNRVDNFHYMEALLKPSYDNYFKRVLIIDESNIIRFDSQNELIGVKYDKLAFFDQGRTTNISPVKSNSVSVLDAQIYSAEGKILGTMVFIPVITLKDAMNFYNILPIIIIFVFVLTIISMMVLLSKILSDGILKPLKELNYAAEIISSGDLDYEMKYKKDDEIGKFCSEFDVMRLRLKTSLEKQARYEQSRKELIASITHDLKTPLTSVKGYVEVLQDGIITDPDTVNNYLNIIAKKTDQLNHLIDDLFTFSKMELGEFQIMPETVQAEWYFTDLFKQRQFEFKESDIEYIFEQPIPSCLLDIDEHRIQQVFENLISNAKKFTRTQIKVYSRIYRDFFEFYVEDDGIGIAHSDLPLIFDHFYKVDKSRTYSSKGTGLGLAICKQIVEAHGGTISVRSETNKGTIFKIKLPIHAEGQPHVQQTIKVGPL